MIQLGNSICLSSKLKCKKKVWKKKNIQIYSENKKEMKNWKMLPLYLGDQNEKFECFWGGLGKWVICFRSKFGKSSFIQNFV